jgi:hypothetical protein
MNSATIPTSSAPVITGDSPLQEWLRVNEAATYSRLSKPKLYDLMNRGLVRSVSLREKGQIKAARLISFASLRAFLESRATGGEPAALATSVS